MSLGNEFFDWCGLLYGLCSSLAVLFLGHCQYSALRLTKV
jgi:hypothetical protein